MWSEAFKMPKNSGMLVRILKSAAISKSCIFYRRAASDDTLSPVVRINLTFLSILANPRSLFALSLIPKKSSLNLLHD